MSNYLHGKIEGVRFCNVARCVIEKMPEANLIAVRSIDSTVAPESIQQILNLHHIPFRKANGNVFLSMDSLLNALSKQIFTGFDEFWFFQGEEPSENLSGLPRATSDSEDFSASVPVKIAECMRQTGCVLLVGDGNGLNYLTPDGAIVEALTKPDFRSEC
jgi:hypothetical protein